MSLQESFLDGTAFVDLTEVEEPRQIVENTLIALRVPASQAASPEVRLQAFLKLRRLLLILDNCEPLIPAAAPMIRALLRNCPDLRILATSRRSWGNITGERVYTVTPLTIPSPALLQRPENEIVAALPEFSAVRLFSERLTDRQPGFTLTARNATAVARICRLLDGLPLALELAAGWAQTLGLDEILSRLSRAAASAPAPELPRSHRTLLTAIEASYRMLSAAQQRFFARLCAFRGSWPLEAARAICLEEATAERLGELQDRSLLIAEPEGSDLRFRLLEAIRQFGRTQLARSSDLPNVLNRHLDFFLAQAEATETELTGPNQAACLERLELDHDNFRAALDHAEALNDGEKGLRLAGALWRFWYAHDHCREGYEWLTRMLTIGSEAPPALRLKAHGGAGNLAYRQTQYVQAQTHYEARLELEEEAANTRGIASALGSLANVACSTNDYARARNLFERSLSLFRETADARGISLSLGNLAIVACAEGDHALAGRYHTESIEMFRRSGDLPNLMTALNNLAETKLILREEADIGPLLRESLTVNRAIEIKHTLAHVLRLCSALAVRQGRWEHGAVLTGAEEALRERINVPAPPAAAAGQRQHQQALLEQLGSRPLQEANRRGRLMTEAEAIQFALSAL
jgi:non-specific serine/threonine protein kinase